MTWLKSLGSFEPSMMGAQVNAIGTHLDPIRASFELRRGLAKRFAAVQAAACDSKRASSPKEMPEWKKDSANSFLRFGKRNFRFGNWKNNLVKRKKESAKSFFRFGNWKFRFGKRKSNLGK